MGRGMVVTSTSAKSQAAPLLTLSSEVIPMTRVEGLEEVKLALKLAFWSNQLSRASAPA